MAGTKLETESHDVPPPGPGNDDAATKQPTLPRILLLIDKRGNREQVARQLRRHGEVLIPPRGSLPEQGFDLAVVDGAGLHRWQNELMQARQHEKPVFLPVMLILSPAELRRQAGSFRDLIDDFIITPINPGEFLERIGMHLRTRQLALQQRQHLAHALNHDSTTGLPTHRLLLEHLETTIAVADAKTEEFYVVVGHTPLARFVQSLGPGAVEDIVEAIASDMYSTLSGDFFMARTSSEQGATVLPVGTSLAEVIQFSQQLIQIMQRSRLIRGEWVRPLAYLGVARYPDDAKDAAGLLSAATSAMNEAQRASEAGALHFYSPIAQSRALRVLRIETELHQALARQEFELWFQPQFRLTDLTMVGAEALIRWRKSSGELVSPGVFIPVAEQAGLIRQIDSWVIEAACAALSRWRQSELECPRIAINITPEDLTSAGFVSWLIALLGKCGLPPSAIEIEMTETMLMNVDQTIQDSLRVLRKHGIRVSIDDFGTGYSSLSYLQQLPADVLKIDKSFIDHVPHNGGGQLITNAIIALAGQFGLEVVAEGIETREQLEYLRNFNVQTGQGYLVSRPLPEAEFIQAIRNGLAIGAAP